MMACLMAPLRKHWTWFSYYPCERRDISATEMWFSFWVLTTLLMSAIGIVGQVKAIPGSVSVPPVEWHKFVWWNLMTAIFLILQVYTIARLDGERQSLGVGPSPGEMMLHNQWVSQNDLVQWCSITMCIQNPLIGRFNGYCTANRCEVQGHNKY